MENYTQRWLVKWPNGSENIYTKREDALYEIGLFHYLHPSCHQTKIEPCRVYILDADKDDKRIEGN